MQKNVISDMCKCFYFVKIWTRMLREADSLLVLIGWKNFENFATATTATVSVIVVDEDGDNDDKEE